ncbi:dephosphocoenzyme A kinase [Paucilactobacillus suebicus DSM 5007 = KCTC 3549]|uniref:Dephospho-CoA kinase n=1 Tax=Paucilactobacillus suebicus DSM 5007 = KCTC 3549 TaxID=1423807 RepID=A0A0R1WGU2_9LACO|nr:dephosphocoenzyme A kinase [Paucilactobacillus suebicus DSM 5007 = KCTC 3549]
MTKVLGLTGGIATGKSTVTNIFKKFNFPVISADEVAREVVEPGTNGLAQIVETFGEQFLNSDGTLNRSKLGKLVFSDHDKLDKLNDLLQPVIHHEIGRQITKLKENHPALIVLEIPLLFEQHNEEMVDYVMVVSTSDHDQLKRLKQRNGLSNEEASQRINSQIPLKDKINLADIVIDNSGSVEETRKQVVEWLANHNFIIIS